MDSYRTVWRGVVGLVAAFGCALALVAWHPSGLVVLAVLASALGCVCEVVRGTHGAGARPGAKRYAKAALLAVLAAVGVAGTTMALGPAGFSLVALLLVSAPPVADRVRRWVQPDDGAGHAFRSSLADKSAVRSMDDAALCLTWRASCRVLQTRTDVAARAAVADLRAALLDELERRHPSAFREWMSSGAGAGSDPSEYLRSSPDH